MSFKKKILMILFLTLCLLIGYGVYVGQKSLSGYCFSTAKTLSDNEKITLVVNEILTTYASADEKRIPYRDLNEFFSLNPDCCSVQNRGQEGYTASFTDRLSGEVSSFVHVKYKVRYKTENDVVMTKVIETSPAISNCGRVWNGF